MTIRAIFLCGVLWPALAATSLCAQIRTIARATLDSLANPATVSGSDVMRFVHTTVDAGTMSEEDAPRSYDFRWTNHGTKPLVVTHTATTCGCITATHSKQPVMPGKEGLVTVTYAPKGHPGSFSRRIFVYTQLSDKQPSAVLTLSGTVTPSKLSASGFSATMGALEVSRKAVIFDGKREGTQQARIACRNAGSKPLRLGYDRNLLPKGFSFSCEPAELAPGAEGRLTISYEPQAGAPALPPQFPLLLTGLGVPPSQATIRIRIDNE